MNRRDVYDSPLWPPFREAVLDRDGSRCVLAWLVGGRCSGALHVHHIEPVEERPDLAWNLDNAISACASHHPTLESLRRELRRRPGRRRCPHRHTNRAGREACERALNAA